MERWSTRLVAVFCCLALLASTAAAQVVWHHSLPVAGDTLTLIVDGAVPGERVDLRLENTLGAPPSLSEVLFDASFPVAVDGDALVTSRVADDGGRLRIDVLLDNGADAGAPIALVASTPASPGRLARLDLNVVPPVVVVASGAGYERIDLLTGERLLPPIPSNGELKGVAVSADGTESYALYENGRLETWAGQSWTPGPREVLALNPSSDGLASIPSGGVAFVLVRADARPFAPDGELLFPADGFAPLVLEPMGEEVEGRRWAVSDDGLTAFVAEDYLTVREVDLLNREAGVMFTAGRGGDFAIADLAFDGSRLHVVTTSASGRPGSLTTYDLRSGLTDVVGLSSEPNELVVLDGGVTLVVPVSGGQMDVIIDGVVAASMSAEGGQWLDASAVRGGALLLRGDDAGGRSLQRYDVASGTLVEVAESLPAVTRVITRTSALAGRAVLLGDPTGRVWSFGLADGVLAAVSDVLIEPSAVAVQLP